eukprot:262805-Hanusia_phi.AAC.1
MDDVRVCLDCLLLEVAYKAMAEARTGYVGDEEEVHEDPLGGNDGRAESVAGLLELDEREQVHALVLGLLEQRVDPSVVAIHAAQRAEMTKHPRRHSRHRRHRLEEADSANDLGLGELAEAEAREGVKGPAAELDSVVGHAVNEPFDRLVCLPYPVHLLICPDGVVHGVLPNGLVADGRLGDAKGWTMSWTILSSPNLRGVTEKERKSAEGPWKATAA